MSQTTVEQLHLFQEHAARPFLVDGPESDPRKVVDRLRVQQKQNLVQIAPGLYQTADGLLAPDLIVARLVPRGNGTYELVPAYEQWIRLSARLTHVLGIMGQYHTLMRLGRAGFIEIGHYAPKTPMLNLSSWWGHLARVIEDPQFWDPTTKLGAQRLKLYRENMF